MTDIRPNIAAILPGRMINRPVDHRGYPVPWFITEHDDQGRWEFRVLNPNRKVEAIRRRVCWICGHGLGDAWAFAVGPMCGVTRVSAEPPSHPGCAEFAVKTCPFMLLPKAQRRDARLPDERMPIEDIHIQRNPGVTLIWITDSYQTVRQPNDVLFRMGEPSSLSFWREGRPATRAEIDESVTSGLPNIERLVDQDDAEAVALYARMRSTFERLLPAA